MLPDCSEHAQERNDCQRRRGKHQSACQTTSVAPLLYSSVYSYLRSVVLRCRRMAGISRTRGIGVYFIGCDRHTATVDVTGLFLVSPRQLCVYMQKGNP